MKRGTSGGTGFVPSAIGKIAVVALCVATIPSQSRAAYWYWTGNGSDGYWGTSGNWTKVNSSNGYLFNQNSYTTKTVRFGSSQNNIGSTRVSVERGLTDSEPIVFIADGDAGGLTTTGALEVGYNNGADGGKIDIRRGTFNFGSITLGNSDNTKSPNIWIGGSGENATVTVSGRVNPRKGVLHVRSKGTLNCSGGILYVGLVANMTGTTLEIDGGTVKNTSANYMSVADVANSSGTVTVKNGGKYIDANTSYAAIILGMRGAGTLDIADGEVHLTHPLRFCYYSGSSATVRITDGGLLSMPNIHNGAEGTANMTIDCGTIRAYADSESFIPNAAKLTVAIGVGGGTLDANGKAVTIAKQLTGTGAMTYKGGGRVTFSTMPAYSGKTIVEVGTRLVVPSAIAGVNLAITIPDGLAPGVYEVVTISGSEMFAADILSSAALPSDPDVRFILSDDRKRIYCAYGSGINEQVWIGGASGSLNVADNWLSGSVPTSGAAIIGSSLPATLTNPVGSAFAPSSIMFSAGSAAVAIGAVDGEALTDIVAVTNLSSASHTINVPVHFVGDIQVKQDAMAEIDDLAKAHVMFAGGAYAAQGHALENGNSPAVYSRCIFGDYHLYPPANSPWTAVCKGNRNRICIADNSALSVQYAGMLTELYVGNGAKVNVGSASISAKDNRLAYRNYGEMAVTNLMLTGTGDRFMTWGQGASVSPVFKFETITNAMTQGDCFYLSDGTVASKGIYYIGAGGLNFSSTSAVGSYCIGGNYADDAQTIRPWYSDFTIGDRGDGNFGLAMQRGVTFCTDDEGGVGRTITIDAITRGSGTTPKITVSGSGMLKVNKAAVNNTQPTVVVTNTATLAIKPGASLGTGATTVADGAALQVAESGTVALGGNLTLADGAVLGFNFTEKAAPVLDVTGKTVTFSGQSNVVVKVSATEGKRGKGGKHALTSGGKFAGATISLVDKPNWVKGISVVDGDIVLEVKSTGLVVIVK